MNRLAVQALEKMETRKFNSKSKGRREGSCGALDTLSSSSTSDCAICLEKYIDGEVMAGAGAGPGPVGTSRGRGGLPRMGRTEPGRTGPTGLAHSLVGRGLSLPAVQGAS